MWPDSDFETKRGTVRLEAPLRANAGQVEIPSQEVVDYYLAKASAMRSHQFHRVFSRGWKAMRRVIRRQLSPCRRVKLPPTAA